MIKVLFWTVLVLSASVVGAQTYTVSGGALAYTPLSTSTATPVSVSGTGNATAAISPTGFSASIQGSTVSSFQISSFGRVRFAPTGITNKSQNDLVSDLSLAPFWAPVVPGAAGAVHYELVGNELVVEWVDCEWYSGTTPAPTVTFQLRLEMTTGVIEFRYATQTGSPPVSGGPYAVCVTGAQGAGSAIPMTYGELAGFVGSAGSMTVWPVDSFIRFTPAGGSPPSIIVTITNSTYPTPQPGVQPQISPRSLASLNFQIAVDDGDSDPVSLDATVGSSTSVPSNLIDAEFASSSAATPYTLNPTSGSLDDGNITYFILIADDGTNNSVLTFSIWSYKTPKPKSGLQEAAERDAARLCSISPGAGTPLVPLAALIAGALLRRRKISRKC